jgi:dihydroorotase
LPLNEGTVTLERADTDVADEIDGLVPFHAGQTMRWRMAGD